MYVDPDSGQSFWISSLPPFLTSRIPNKTLEHDVTEIRKLKF
jgi:hypothetical protein